MHVCGRRYWSVDCDRALGTLTSQWIPTRRRAKQTAAPTIGKARLCVPASEAATNVVVHAYRDAEQPGQIDVAAALAAEAAMGDGSTIPQLHKNLGDYFYRALRYEEALDALRTFWEIPCKNH